MTKLNALSGRVKREAPGPDEWDLAEWMQFEQFINLPWQTISNGAVRMSKRVPAIDVTNYYFGLDVPAGRKFYLFSRGLRLAEGLYFIDVLAGGFTGGEVAVKSTLRRGAEMTVQTNVFAGVTPVGGLTVIDEDFVDNGNMPGNQAPLTVADTEGLLLEFGPGQALIRVTRQQAEVYRASIRVIGWGAPL